VSLIYDRETLAEALLCAADAAMVNRQMTDSEIAATDGGNALVMACDALGLSYAVVHATIIPLIHHVAQDARANGVDLDYRSDGGQIGGAVAGYIEAAYRLREGSL
jgi:hypothetical protein